MCDRRMRVSAGPVEHSDFTRTNLIRYDLCINTGGSLMKEKKTPSSRQQKRTFTGRLSASWSWDLLHFKGWRLVAIGGWRRLAAVGSGWRLAIGGWWGWRLAVGGGWWSLTKQNSGFLRTPLAHASSTSSLQSRRSATTEVDESEGKEKEKMVERVAEARVRATHCGLPGKDAWVRARAWMCACACVCVCVSQFQSTLKLRGTAAAAPQQTWGKLQSALHGLVIGSWHGRDCIGPVVARDTRCAALRSLDQHIAVPAILTALYFLLHTNSRACACGGSRVGTRFRQFPAVGSRLALEPHAISMGCSGRTAQHPDTLTDNSGQSSPSQEAWHMREYTLIKVIVDHRHQRDHSFVTPHIFCAKDYCQFLQNTKIISEGKSDVL